MGRTWIQAGARAGATWTAKALLAGVSALAIAAPPAFAADPAAPAEGAQPATALPELIVTAQKREQALDKVPMSITAVSARQLVEQGIVRITDLGRVVPGFTFTQSQVGTPIYTLRGVGFVDISMGGRPTVSVYDDQAPIPFTIETIGGNLDLARIEVLKGPQGTLFGQNATGGAVNLIPAKPTDTFQAGIDASYGSFNAVDVSGYVSGPLGDTVGVRLAVRHDASDDWQQSDTSSATNGAVDLTTARLLVDWRPVSRLKIELNLNGFVDRSESQAPQVSDVVGLPQSAQLVPALADVPIAPANDRAADWIIGKDYRRDNRFVQANLRGDYQLNDALTLTSLTSYSHYDENQPVNVGGTPFPDLDQTTRGSINSWYEEARLSGEIGHRTYFVLGGDYSSDKVLEMNYDDVSGGSEAYTFASFGLPAFDTFRDIDDQYFHSYAVFGNVDYDITDTVKVTGGVRYTRAVDHFSGCSADTGDGNAASVFGPFENIVRGAFLGLAPNPPIPPGGCVTANDQFVPSLVVSTLDENNVSWRAGVEWNVRPQTMLYANVSKGYKAGGYPDLGATKTSQFEPATQESVLAYEAGFKSRLLDGALQLNGAAFYYDYDDKQVLGSVSDPLFGRLLKLINIPRSRIVGGELQATWIPVRGLTLDATATYVGSEILDNFTNYNPFGAVQDFGGEPFPNTPRWQAGGGANYQWPLTDKWDGFGRIDVAYKSATNTGLGEDPLLAVKAYSLVDLSAGAQSHDGALRAWIWVRNLANTYYWSGAYLGIDTAVRYTGMPRTIGVALAWRFGR
jgi:outer membrane receptor protein involved in Fe transport